MTNVKKTSITVTADQDLILDLRRTLFKHGLSVDSFFHFLIAKASIKDERLMLLMDEAIDSKKNEDSIFKQINSRKVKNKIDSEMIYEMIESELRANKEE